MKIKICENNADWSRFTEFYITNRRDIIPGYTVSSALLDVKHYIRHGRGAILMDWPDEMIGIGSFVLGLEERKFDRKDIAVLGNCYFVERHRSTRTFIRGLQVLAEQIDASSDGVEEVRIPALAGNRYTNKLYSKIADKIETRDTAYGTVHMYSTSFPAFAAYCGRFR
ncbi:hypothetical protein RB620_29430 [Paenibacillus sp. LHD-117]|uniref:hypothetical protein n=1 Tax=Paenibacillus sp. LHD-117 TaxID=3071412 RepID=UPI0027DF4145|nr:hypothetical protein [Paenibacillus sp. LHD-117]MDQ6423538.1 hypothetical protein [Paenibacillus sp. LHD-117]